MDPPLEVDLAQPVQSGPLGDIDQVPDLHRVAGEERDLLEQAAASRVLAGERLDKPRQLGEEEVDQRPSDELGHAPAAALAEHPALHDRALVVALDVLQARLVEQWPERPVDHPRVPVAHVRVSPDDQVAGRLVQRFPERLALAPEAAVAAQDVGMLDDAGALGLGDLAGSIRRRRVDHHDLVEQWHPTHHLPDRAADDRADRLLLVERRQHEAHRQALLLLELREPAEVGELGVVEVRFAEPALDAGGHGARLLRGAVSGGQRLGAGRELLERLATDGLARLDDDDGGLRARGDRLGHRTEEVGRAIGRARRRGAHDHDVRVIRFAQDRGAHVRGLAHQRVDLPLDVLLDERRQRALGLRAHRERDPGGDDVQRGKGRVVARRDRAGDVQRQLGMGAAADRHHDPLEVADASLLDDGDIAW